MEKKKIMEEFRSFAHLPEEDGFVMWIVASMQAFHSPGKYC